MTQLNLLPWVISREWTNDGKLASGAKIYTYQSGTNTPKTTYKNYDGSVLNTNPIICDASGAFTCFLGTGAYRIKINDQNDVQIMPQIDGVVGAGLGGVDSNSTATTIFLKTYNDLRGLSTSPDFVYVAGRDVEGDGGQGWFQLIPGSSLIDDDSIVLTANTGSFVYYRIFDSVIDPRWTGVKYGVSIDQSTAFNRNIALSVKYGLPVLFTDSVFINTNITVTSGAIIDIKGVLVSTLSVTITFQSGSVVYGESRCFGVTVQPIFNNNSTVKLSWMGGTIADDRWNKLIASTSGANSASLLSVDESISISNGTINISAPIAFCNNSIVTITDTSLNLSAPFIKLNQTQMFNISSVSNINAVDLGNQFVMPEVFGATGNIINDQWKAILAAFRTGKVILSKSRIYSILTAIPTLGNLEIIGGGALYLATNIALTTTNFTIRDTGIGLQTPGNWITTQIFNGYQSFFPSTITVTNSKVIDGCIYSDKPDQFPVYDGKPNIYNAYLPLLPNTRSLETDGSGKIIAGSSFKYDLNNWNCVGYFPHYEGSSVIGFTIEYPTNGSGYIWALSSRVRSDRAATLFNRPSGDIEGFWTEQHIPVPNQLVGSSGWHCQGFKALGSLYVMFVKSYSGSNYLLTIWTSLTPFDANSWTLRFQGSQVASSSINWDFDCIPRDGNTLYASAGSYTPGVTYKVASNGTVTTQSGAASNLMNIIGYDYENHKILAAASISSVSNFGMSTNEGLTWTWYPVSDANLYGAAHCNGTVYSIGGYKPSWNIPGYWVIDTVNGTPYFVDTYVNQATPSNIGSMRAIKDSIIAVAPGNQNIILAGPRNGNGLSQKYSPYTTGYIGSIEYNEYYAEVLLGGNNNMILSGI